MTAEGADARQARAVPRATYRLQFSRAFTFRDAERLVPYLDALGVSHVYASPVLAARTGSTHGYDITDHNALNPELGEPAEFERFVDALHRNGMGLVLDFVPNHIGIGRSDNAWWLDVLEWGQASPYAAWFDIDWEPAKQELRGKVLVPLLGDHYGRVLENGELELRFDEAAGSFSVWYHEHCFPVGPPHYARILGIGADTLSDGPAELRARVEGLVTEFRALRPPRMTQRLRAEARARTPDLKRALADACATDPALRSYVRLCTGRFNGTPGQGRSYMALHRLLQRQSYRPAYWRVAANEINYRRFFDINELAGLRIERQDLFDIVHRLVLQWIRDGRVDGLRIDHIDGLFDPRQYCQRLQAAIAACRPPEIADEPFYLIVEKILAADERVRGDWPVAGTSGYEFANLLGGIFIDPAGLRGLDQAYRRLTGQTTDFDAVLYACKMKVMDSLLAAELTVLANELDRIAETSWRTRDFTLDGIREALTRVVASFRVYRTYVTPQGADAEDRAEIDRAVAHARRVSPDVESSTLDFIHAVLTTDLVRRRDSGYGRTAVIRVAMKFQQFTGPVMAKAMEDTAFYRFNRLVALNEVGGDPRRFAVSLAAFHRANAERAATAPTTMLATTTHDTKRAEDVRARLCVLAELPVEWSRRVRGWFRLNRGKRRAVEGGHAPTANDEYLLYQTLVGAWPAEFTGAPVVAGAEWETFRSRIAEFMAKAVREAKAETSWATPNVAYEQGVRAFTDAVLDIAAPNPFIEAFAPFQAFIARIGMVNSLAQTTLKLTVPGVPDIYQGCEVLNLSLVDPDNRRPVDFTALDRLRASVNGADARPFAAADGPAVSADGRAKMLITARLLARRRALPALFAAGTYVPIDARGSRADHICAFLRVLDGSALLVAVPRLTAKLADDDGSLPPPDALWEDSWLPLPAEYAGQAFHDLFTDARVGVRRIGDAFGISAARVFARFPVAALMSTGGDARTTTD